MRRDRFLRAPKRFERDRAIMPRLHLLRIVRRHPPQNLLRRRRLPQRDPRHAQPECRVHLFRFQPHRFFQQSRRFRRLPREQRHQPAAMPRFELRRHQRPHRRIRLRRLGQPVALVKRRSFAQQSLDFRRRHHARTPRSGHPRPSRRIRARGLINGRSSLRVALVRSAIAARFATFAPSVRMPSQASDAPPLVAHFFHREQPSCPASIATRQIFPNAQLTASRKGPNNVSARCNPASTCSSSSERSRHAEIAPVQ